MSGEAGPDDSAGDGADAVAAAVNRARAAATARGDLPGRQRLSPTAAKQRQRREGAITRSSARPDARDPQAVGSAIDRLITERGWSEPVAVGGVLGRWDQVVGADIAAHCQPLSFDDGVLTVGADSSAWAANLKLLVPALLGRLDQELGQGTVHKVVVRGPSAPSWKRGPRLAPGSQGPRDTYG